MYRRWLVSRTNPEYIRYISKIASISPALSQILINRGIKTPQEINDFLNPRLSDLSDPFELPGVKTAVERIRHAINANETVLVHGDYDADGLTATAIMVHALRILGLNVHYFIPNRITHGYGFNPVSVKIAKELGVSLIITVDCGITSFDAASYARQEGIDVIITDHHEPAIRCQVSGVRCQVSGTRGQELGISSEESESRTQNLEPNTQNLEPNTYSVPDAVAVINPKISNFKSQISNLSGAGVAFKIAQALCSASEQWTVPAHRHYQQTPTLCTDTVNCLLDLAAIGTMADVVPLTGENRIIVREGMKLIQEGQRHGIKALKSVAGLDNRELRAGLLSFTIIPRINAAGRIADSQDVVRLLLSDIDEEALDLSSWLDRLNSARQKIEEEVYQEALAKLNTDGLDSVIVLSEEGWHQGVAGIVAARLAEEFYRPAFILSVENGVAKGSARSIPSFDICKGLAECGELLLSFGGHKQAAGIKLKVENIPDFKKTMQEIIKSSLTEDDFIPSLEIDADITLADVKHSLIKELSMLEPLGYGNAEPFLGSKRLEVVNPRIVGSNHLKMRLKQGSQSIDAIGFDMAAAGGPPAFIDAVFTPNVNEWEGGRHLQLNLKAFRPSK